MKILFIGHYKEGTGWAKSAQCIIKSMHSVGIDVVCRNITLTKDNPVDPLFDELEKKDTNNVDICIQHVLPHHLVATNKFKKNIAYTLFESMNLSENKWIQELMHMDEVWVACEDNQKALIEAGINNVKVIHIPADMSHYSQETRMNIDLSRYGIKSAYKFYTIADMNQRKNLEGIVSAYYSAFNSTDDVSLILKISKFGSNKQSVFDIISKMCKQIRRSLAIYPSDNDYPHILIMSDRFSDDEIKNLHQICDCFINLSHGEAWSIPSFEAMCYGNHPICTGWGGPKEYINPENKRTGFLIDYTYKVCSNEGAAFSHIFTGKEYWACPDEWEAAKAMRFYFEQREDYKENLDGIKQGQLFDMNKVGKKIQEILND